MVGSHAARVFRAHQPREGCRRAPRRVDNHEVSVDEQDPDFDDTVSNLKHAQHLSELLTAMINSTKLPLVGRLPDRGGRRVSEAEVTR
jgi:hypothetical protein